MRGWVYVITNKSMPDLVKVGFSSKDPAVRAKDLGRTGVPHPYVVVYDALVDAPRNAERKIHAKLEHLREAKEWFRCSVSDAIAAIRGALPGEVLLEKALSPQPLKHAPTPTQRPESETAKLRVIGTYVGSCSNCGEQISATLTRHDTTTRCPVCLRDSEVAAFQRSELVL